MVRTLLIRRIRPTLHIRLTARHLTARIHPTVHILLTLLAFKNVELTGG